LELPISATDFFLWRTVLATFVPGRSWKLLKSDFISIADQLAGLYGDRGQPSLTFLEWIMGFPTGYTAIVTGA
jgi:hypothetical protein